VPAPTGLFLSPKLGFSGSVSSSNTHFSSPLLYDTNGIMSTNKSKNPIYQTIIHFVKHMENRTPAEDIYRKIGQKIAQTRKDLNITQQGLAAKTHLTRQTITLYETGARRIPLVSLLDIAKALHTSLYELIPTESRKPGPESKIDKELSKIKQLPAKQQKLVLEVIQSVLKHQ
jgi:transcriptional regulator with XRE-family HTH domain